ncbi:MAG: hypothetical protein H0Z35_12455 [Thermoanaerobacteraceae bacterium]|nr:hypothetical protein [Thermoanaerobacteraceae bacterium]
MQELLKEYRETYKMVRLARVAAKEADRKEDYEILGNVLVSLAYIIKYLDQGFPPEDKRGIYRSKWSQEQREIPFDPEDAFFVREVALQRKKESQLTEEQREMLKDLLAILTEKEREVFIMVRGNGLSFAHAAYLMGVRKGTVQNLVTRAEKKLHFVVRKPTNSEGVVQRVLF